MKTSRHFIDDALGELAQGLWPWVDDCMQSKHGKDWIRKEPKKEGQASNWQPLRDPHYLLTIVVNKQATFERIGGYKSARKSCLELLDDRNLWAHYQPLDNNRARNGIKRCISLLSKIHPSTSGPIEKTIGDSLERLKNLSEEFTESLCKRLDAEQPRKLDFDNRIRTLSQDFAEREWLFDEVLARIQSSTVQPRCLLIVGPPGSGKSSFAAELVRRSHNSAARPVIAWHFCQADDAVSINPGGFVHSLAAILREALPEPSNLPNTGNTCPRRRAATIPAQRSGMACLPPFARLNNRKTAHHVAW